ncbi:unnamed protein product [Rotaria socialis]|uniref:Ubiquitin-like domain-containing protein n=1 Tax=Rotaria socialis TaxID=392032 RepID=A0A820KX15_9BILA|nr:unnamed protein product [Rotaria socialis]CAF3404759.1 unnamed protein product [Rotaria socialis]CAF3409195.1 unnamed protein product [Rotaria socialis]CAF3435474.1 unnamed protein product [Rotaria socialis]CAF3686420.1 unnamed protein product [Rotaria socialis]
MSNLEIKSRFHILHVEVSHGSDRHDIHIHMERPPLVRDLMEEVENKSHVTMPNQQLIFRGQRLHQNPDAELAKFGLFNGNRIMLIGEKLAEEEDGHFQRLLTIEKDVKLIDDVLELVCRDFENIKQSQQPRSRCEHFLFDLQQRGERAQTDLKAFQSITNNLNLDTSEMHALKKRSQVAALIQDRIDVSSNIISAISSYQGGGQNGDANHPDNK